MITRKLFRIYHLLKRTLFEQGLDTLPGVQYTKIELSKASEQEKTLSIMKCVSEHSPAVAKCLVAPGLSPTGPEDPRLKRFAGILASIGYCVYVPYLQDYIDLHVKAETSEEFGTYFEWVLQDKPALKGQKVTILSISFGSLLTLETASHPVRSQHLDKIVLVGGYVNWQSTCRSMVLGDKVDGKPHTYDRRLLPVILKHLIEDIPLEEPSRRRIYQCVQDYIALTWAQEVELPAKELKTLSEPIWGKLSSQEKDIFLRGCGLIEGSEEFILELLGTTDKDYLDPGKASKAVSCPTFLLHGTSDRIISPNQFHQLRKNIPEQFRRMAILTPLFSHSSKSTDPGLKSIPQKAAALLEFTRLLWALIP